MNGTVRTARDIYSLSQTQQLPFLAAAIAYYAFLSAVPLLIVAVAIATAIAGDALAERLLASLDELLTPEAAVMLESTILAAPGRSTTAFAGVVVLAWSSLRVFRGLDIAFSRVYDIRLYKSIPEQLRDAIIVFVAVSIAIAATVTVSTFLAMAPGHLAGLGSLVLVLLLPAAFFPLYYVFPASDVTVREALPGSVGAGLGWWVLGIIFGFYASNAATFELYGILGGVLLLLVWFYFAGLLLLVGAALNAVLAGRIEDRQLQQEGGQENYQRQTMTDDDRPPEGDSTASATGGGPSNGADTVDNDEDPLGDEAGARAGRRVAGDESRDQTVTRADIDELHERLERFEDEIEDRTVHRAELEAELKQYVRRRSRRNHARGWGPYLVLGYGTAMTLGAFYYLGGGWAILAMFVIWLSTLGLYVLMVLFGLTSAALGIPSRVIDRIRGLRRFW